MEEKKYIKQVKILQAGCSKDLEDSINEFLKTIYNYQVVDIKLCENVELKVFIRAMIIYNAENSLD